MSKNTKAKIKIKLEWCKACGICYNLCPKGALDKDETGKAVIKDIDSCILCRICQDHCPDFCIKIGG